jgi:predicted permease
MNQVSPGFFQTFGIALLEGRAFAESDNETAPKVALLNETAARFYFSDRSPIGEHLCFKRGPKAEPMQYQVVGVVRDSRYSSLREPDTRLVYLPMLQSLDQLGRLTLAARGDGQPAALINGVRSQLRAAGKDILVTNIATLDEQVDQSLLQERLVATLSLFFGLLALLLASIGLYGVMSYNVARRTHELGIRMALGARPGDVTRSILREALVLAAIGIGVGLPLVLVATRLIKSQLFGVRPNDPVTLVIMTSALVTVALLAAWLPARRAAKVEPLVALRYE